VRLQEYLWAVQRARQNAQGIESIMDAVPEVPPFFLEPPDSGKLQKDIEGHHGTLPNQVSGGY
jgi:hypothetical protein